MKLVDDDGSEAIAFMGCLGDPFAVWDDDDIEWERERLLKLQERAVGENHEEKP